MSRFLKQHSLQVLRRCHLTWGSHAQPLSSRIGSCHSPAVNHAGPAFTEYKRCRVNPAAITEMVNPKAVAVYQTDRLLNLIGCVHGRCRRMHHDATSTEYVDVQEFHSSAARQCLASRR